MLVVVAVSFFPGCIVVNGGGGDGGSKSCRACCSKACIMRIDTSRARCNVALGGTTVVSTPLLSALVVDVDDDVDDDNKN